MIRSAINRARDPKRNEAGFTLIELLIVIVILGILAAIVVFSVRGITDKGDLAACKTEVSTVDTAEEASYANGDGYQAAISQLQTDGYLHGSGGGLKYVASYDTTNHVVVLQGSGIPAGCTAQ